MHVTTKEVDDEGVHILTSVIEGDGAVELASKDAKFEVGVISAQRTDSGGVKIQVALKIVEPKPPTPAAPAPANSDQEALAYLKSKGIKDAEAREDLKKFGADRVLAARDKEAADLEKLLDEQLADKLAGA